MTGTGLAPAVAIVGPTASGKTELALDLARRHAAEIVNFDSVQVYQFLDIGSAKPSRGVRREIPHHLIDHVAPCDVYSAGDFSRDAKRVLADLRERRTLPILVGGTGFYLEALLKGLFEGPPRDDALRRSVDESAARHGDGHVWRVLARLDRAAADRIHPNDHPKLVRAIEVSVGGGRPMTEQWNQPRDPLRGYRVLLLGLDPPRDALYARIDLRARRMFAEGLIEEVKRLLDRGIPECWRPLGSLGYAQCRRYLANECSLPEAVEATAQQTRRYAKRQMTWFRNRAGEVRWLHGFGDKRAAWAWAEAEFREWMGSHADQSEVECDTVP